MADTVTVEDGPRCDSAGRTRWALSAPLSDNQVPASPSARVRDAGPSKEPSASGLGKWRPEGTTKSPGRNE